VLKRVSFVCRRGLGLRAAASLDLAQDDAGFIWLVTPGGLFRFDGVEMRRVVGYTPSVMFEPRRSAPVSWRAPRTERWRGPAPTDTPFLGPEDGIAGIDAIARGGDGALWMVRANQVWRRTDDRFESPPHGEGGVAPLAGCRGRRDRGQRARLLALRQRSGVHLTGVKRPLAAVEARRRMVAAVDAR
jgi:hypothetical protein